MFGFDSSGSMGYADYADVGGELGSLLEMFDAWELDLVTCDTAATLLGTYSSEEEDDLGTMDFRAVGGGGTEMSPMVDYANEQFDEGEEFNACIVVTDGYIPEEPVNTSTSEDRMKYIFVVTRGGNRGLQLADAKVIYMDDDGTK
jgi:predicted metal-dependent peptidase